MKSSVPSASSSLRPFGVEQHGIARDRHHRPDPAVARRQDLLGHTRGGQLATELGQSAHPALPHASVAAAHPAQDVHRGPRNQRPARAIEVARDDVEQLDGPLADRAEPLGRDAEPAVTGSPIRCRELARDSADHLGIDTGDGRGSFRRPPGEGLTEFRQPIDVRRWILDAVGQHLVDQGEQERGIRPGPDEVVLIGDGRGFGPARVDHDHPAATRPYVLEAFGETGRGHHAAVRRERVGAEHQQVRRTVDIGHRDHQLMPVQQVRGQHVRQLVDRGRAEPVARAQQPDERRHMRQSAEAVHVRIAEVDADRVLPVLTLDRREPLRHQVVRRLPRQLFPAISRTSYRALQPIRIVLEVAKRHRLGADVPARKRVRLVAADVGDPAVVDRDQHSADRLAQVAGCPPYRRRHPLNLPTGSPDVTRSARQLGEVAFEDRADPGRCRASVLGGGV